MVSVDVDQFLSLKTRADIACLLGIPLRDLTMLAFGDIVKYRSFDISKKTKGQTRTIHAPFGYLKKVQRELLPFFEEVYEANNPPIGVYGFRKDRNIADNAKSHVRQHAVINIDLKDFFPTIGAERIRGLFLAEPFSFPAEVADTLTNLVCHCGSLPQGAPTSPTLSNYICKRMDKQLLSYANLNKLVYTRYADDISFSSSSPRAISNCFPEVDGRLTIDPFIVSCIEKNGFEINEGKTHIAVRSARQMVTGIVVNEKCNFKRQDYRELRVLFRNWELGGAGYAAEEYAAYDRSRSSKVLDEEGRGSELALKKHIRGRLDYFTMITEANGGPSVPLLKLWTQYNKQTREFVPYSLPEASVFKTKCSYSFVGDSAQGVDLYCAEGSAFKISDNRFATCWHCLADEHVGFVNEGACVDVECEGMSHQVALSSLVGDRQIDVATMEMPVGMERMPILPVDYDYVPQLGETVWAYGYADGKRPLRCINARVVEVYDGARMLRVDRPFIQGMSGGPVLNSRHRVIGIVTHGSAPHDYAYDGEFIRIATILSVNDSPASGSVLAIRNLDGNNGCIFI